MTDLEEKIKDFNMFDFIRAPGTSHSVYYAFLDETVLTGRYEDRRDFVAQYCAYKTRSVRRQ